MLEPSIKLFYQVLSSVLKTSMSFATRSVKKIVIHDDDKLTSTACIDNDGVIRINKDFWKENIKTIADVKVLFLHELLHSVLFDTKILTEEDEVDRALANFSMDMRINAAITRVFLSRQESYNTFLNRFYSAKGIEGLLRPGSSYGINNKFRLLYAYLYEDTKTSNSTFKNEKAIRNALKILLDKNSLGKLKGITFLGNHSTEVQPFSEDIKIELRGTLISQLAGSNLTSMQGLVALLKSSSSIDERTLARFACSAQINTLKSFYKKPTKVTSVIPNRISNRDALLIGSGVIPVLWQNRKDINALRDRNVAIYLDVSGSVNEYLPKILGVISNLKSGISTLFCFSNIVSEHTKTELSEGKFKTTGGTDFNCIVDHAIENKINKFIVFTDGHASIDYFRTASCIKQIKDVAIVYFSSYINYDNFFHKQYKKSFELENLLV